MYELITYDYDALDSLLLSQAIDLILVGVKRVCFEPDKSPGFGFGNVGVKK